jgi:hypothetical protein
MTNQQKTPAQRRKRERKLFDELVRDHRYMVFDRLPARDRDSMIFERRDGKQTLVPAIAVKLVLPVNSEIGQAIAVIRAANATKAKTAKAKESKP